MCDCTAFITHPIIALCPDLAEMHYRCIDRGRASLLNLTQLMVAVEAGPDAGFCDTFCNDCLERKTVQCSENALGTPNDESLVALPL